MLLINFAHPLTPEQCKSMEHLRGRLDRGAPCYGEDNHDVYGELLGMSSQEITALVDEAVDGMRIGSQGNRSPWRHGSLARPRPTRWG